MQQDHSAAAAGPSDYGYGVPPPVPPGGSGGLAAAPFGSSMHSRRSSNASTTSSGGMSEEEQNERRKQIRDIMKDPKLSQVEKSKSVQSLMDGRRRSSCGGGTVSSRRGSTCSASSRYSQASFSGDPGNNNNNNNSNNLLGPGGPGGDSSFPSTIFPQNIMSPFSQASQQYLDEPSVNYVSQMAEAAAVAADYYSSDDDDDSDSLHDSDVDVDNDDDDDFDNEDEDGAAAAAANDSDGDACMSDAGGDTTNHTNNNQQQQEVSVNYGYNEYADDYRSVASSVTHTSAHSDYPVVSASLASLGYYNITNNAAAGNAKNANTPAEPKSLYKQIHGRSLSLQEWTDESRAAAAAHASTTLFRMNPAKISRLMEQSRPVCEHYERNCTLVSPCCGLAFGCRICHDDCPVLPPPLALRKKWKRASAKGAAGATTNTPSTLPPGSSTDNKKLHSKMDRRRSMPLDLEEELNEIETHHLINRFAIREVICRRCYTRQSSKTNNCMSCGVQFGEYHCMICNLWMSNAESPYHCDDCGFCRVGGRENFRHCHDCGMCIDAMLFEDHNCKAGKYMSNCPVCQEDLFSSRYASHEMPCGHAIHWHCFKELTSFDTRCPVCKKTAETPEHMAATWSAIAMGIALQPVPPDLARVVNIVCNDCEERDVERRWHFLGVRCMHCLSFNTVVEQILLQGREAAEYLDAKEAENSGAGGVPANIISSSSTAGSSTNILHSTNPSAAARPPRAGRSAAAAGGGDLMDEDMPSAQDTSSGSTDMTNL